MKLLLNITLLTLSLLSITGDIYSESEEDGTDSNFILEESQHINTEMFNQNVSSKDTIINDIYELPVSETKPEQLTDSVSFTGSSSQNEDSSESRPPLDSGSIKKHLSDSLLKIKTSNRKLYEYYPQSLLDSTLPLKQSSLFHLFSSDALCLSEALRYNIFFTYVPYSTISQLNRVLYRGIPAGFSSFSINNNSLDNHPGFFSGSNALSTAEIKNLQIKYPGEIEFFLFPEDVISPNTSVLWENGPFNENSLNVRFSRHITENVKLGIFSSYRGMSRKEYTHTRGGMYQFFEPMYYNLGLDSSYIAKDGYNPLVNEHIVSARTIWQKNLYPKITFQYKYEDTHNDLSYAPGWKDTLLWEKLSRYYHKTSILLNDVETGLLYFNSGFFYRNGISKTNPLYSDQSRNSQKGDTRNFSFNLNPFIPFSDDTVSFSTDFTNKKIGRFGQKDILHYKHGSFLFDFSQNHKFAEKFHESLLFQLGYDLLSIDDKFKGTYKAKIGIEAESGQHRVSFYSKRDILPPEIPFDTLYSTDPAKTIVSCKSIEADYNFKSNWVSFLLGYSYIEKIDSSVISRYWPGGIPPYGHQKHIITFSPMFGRWHGLAFNSSFFISPETMPNLKARGHISFHSKLRYRRPRFFVDLMADYWSRRKQISYGGIDIWNRPVIDVKLKITAQIKTFRLFYKIDNFLNRKISYIPGYYIPGIVFRWGFNWMIPE